MKLPSIEPVSGASPQCNEMWMQGDFCLQSCGRCPMYPAVLPSVSASGPKSGSIVQIAARMAPYKTLSQLSDATNMKIPGIAADAANIAGLTARPIRPLAEAGDRFLEVGRDYVRDPCRVPSPPGHLSSNCESVSA